MEMNAAQKQVVDHTNGPLLVVAGAGTGKTRVLVEKICKLLAADVPAREILALTFTEKAASEMLERVLEARTGYEPELPIMTFNGFGESLLREFNTDAGLARNFLLIGENAQVVFLRQHLASLNLDYYAPISNPEGQIPDLADYFSKLKQHVITPADYKAYADGLKPVDEADKLEKARHQELANAYDKYLTLCKEQNVIDYDDQIYQVIQLLESRPNVLKKLRERYHTIMVDEFQDTNPMQSCLIDLLVGEQKRLIVVGDDDQSIYGFRGATLANILDFKSRYPEAKEVALTENYRSSQQLLDSAYQLVQNNNPDRLEAKLGINKQLHAQVSGEPALLKQFRTLDQELQWIAKDVAKQITAGVKPGDIAVLCRRNKTAQLISQQLQLQDIDHVVVGQRFELYRTEVVRMLVEALRAVVDPSASTSLYHTLSGALFNIPVSQLAGFAADAKRSHQSLEEFLFAQNELPKEITDALDHLVAARELSATAPVGRLVYSLIEQTGYKDKLYQAALKNDEAAFAITQLSNFFKTLKEFESIALQPTTLQYIESFNVLEAAGESNEDPTLQISDQMVSVVTVHKSKGLEWDTVYIPDCTEGSFPMRAMSSGLQVPDELVTQSSSAADEHTAEERRLMYVAMTRAKSRLVMSYAHTHTGSTIRKPSRFLAEAFSDELVIQPDKKTALVQQDSDVPMIAHNSDQHRIAVPHKIFDGTTAHLSVSQITTFLNCPLDFYYRFVLNVPQPPNPAAKYGSAIHAVIEDINISLLTGDVIPLDDALESLDTLWGHEGFISKEHAERSYKQARKTIESFYDRHVVHGTDKPTQIEASFALPLTEENLVIKGRFDAVFERENGAEIRDYKTSTSVDNPEKAKRRASGSDQLTLYALVWQEMKGELPTLLSLEFVDTGEIGTVKKTQRGIDGMRAKLATITPALKAKQFTPGKDHTYCQHPEV